MEQISILVVEDEEKILSRLSKIFIKDGYQIDTANCGTLALEKLHDFNYDIMLTDLKMPDKNGFEVLEYLKKHKSATLPIILTGYASVEGAIQAIKLGAYDFIQKPVNTETLRHAVRKAAETALLRKQNEEQVQQLKKLNELKDEFLAVVSHDLRSPLASIGGYVNYLIKKGELSDQQHKYLNIIKDINENLYNLVNELLDISKLESGVIELFKEDTNIDELISTSITNFKMLAEDKNIKIKYINKLNDNIIYVDKMKLIQIINNLLSNAVKFTENGVISVKLIEENDNIILSVQDSGIGISEDEISCLFDKLNYFNKPGTKGEKGTGLGLVICKKFVELLDGRIELTSQPGKGSTFTVTFPRSKVK